MAFKHDTSLTFTDIFCGAGGSSTGLVAAGYELKLAANHWQQAIETHTANHRDADHLCADINNYDMRRLPRTDVLWASPICTELSPAGGRRRKARKSDAGHGQVAIEEFGHVPSAAFDRTRATFWDVIRATEVNRYKVILVENVMEAADWELFDTWLAGMRVLGYRQQYVYRCPNGSRCRHAIVEPYVRPAASIIDWSNLGVRIGDRPAHGLRPLAGNTVKRIRSGLSLLGDQRMVVTVNHGGHDGRAFVADKAPLPARTAKIGDAILVPTGGTWNTTATTTAQPMRTRLANPKGFEALVTPPPADDSFIVTLRRNASTRPVSEPVDTVTGQGRHHWLVVPYRNAATKSVTEPLHTLSTVDSAGLLGPAPALEDCHYRMIQPREQLLAQRFPGDYIVLGNKGEQTMQAGNAVSCNTAQWLANRVKAAL